jgi:hypothetical protein
VRRALTLTKGVRRFLRFGGIKVAAPHGSAP